MRIEERCPIRVGGQAVLWLAALTACSDPPACPSGTHLEAERCVADGSSPDMDASGGAMDAAPASDANVSTDAAAPSDAGDDEGDAGPTPPTFPSTIRRLSVAIRTGDETDDGSDGAFRVCLNADRCFDLDVPSVDDFRRGDFDVFHYTGVDLPRSEVDRVELRHVSGENMWHPACVEVRFDGEPVHCSRGQPRIGNGGGGEVRRFRERLRNECVTCYPTRVTHGPLVGAVGPTSAHILVRTDATRPVSLRIAREATPSEVVATVGPRWPRPGDDYTTTFEVTGLSPRTRYVADVLIGDHVTPRRATFRTAPRVGRASRFRIALGSCSNNDTIRTPHGIFDTIAGKDPDLFLFLGDNHYGNTGNTQGHWWNYRDVLAMPPRARLVSSTSVLAIWDDHDFTGNNSTRHASGRDRALRAFTDYWANPRFGTAEQPGVFFRTSYGDVDLFMLDVRYERDRPNTGGSILGARQLAWLESELRRSTATFKILASGSLVSQSGGETWRDYATRDALFRLIRVHDIRGVLAVSGDIHRSELRRIHRAHYDMPEIIASGLANVDNSECRGAPGEVDRLACLGGTGSFAVLDVDTTREDPRIVARLFDPSGTQRGVMTILASQLR